MTVPALPEIREADASAEVGVIYRDICLASGLPLVNLAWRHFAALPGVLPWVWATLGPAYRSGAVARAAARLRGGPGDLALSAIRPEDLQAVGLKAEDRAAFANMLAVYNRGNTSNLIGFTALRRFLEGDFSAPAVDAGSVRAPPPALAPLPPLPRLESLAPAPRSGVDRLASRHREFPAGAVPSLYLHFACWPRLPDMLAGRLAPLFDEDRLEAAARAVEAVAGEEARGLAASLAASGRPPEGVGEAVARFASGAIPPMIVVGTVLEAALAPD